MCILSSDVGSITKVGGGAYIEGHLGRVLGSEIEHLVWGVKQCKPARGSGGILPWEILKVKSSEIAGKFLYLFLYFQSFQGG